VWAQLITLNVKPERMRDLPTMYEQLQSAEQPDSGLLRTTFLVDEKEPGRAYILVVFASEDHARARERDPRRRQGLAAMQATMAEVLAGPPQFADLTVLLDDPPANALSR
jgi:quinol monooxygenase YgiN